MPLSLATLSEIEDRLFAERAIRWFGGAIFATNLTVFAWALIAGKSAFGLDGRPNPVDFVQFYVAGLFAHSVNPAAAYNYSAFAAAQAALVGGSPGALPYYHPIYPPIVFLLTSFLGLLPYFAAFAVWVGGSFLFYIAAVYLIVPRAAVVLLAAGLPLVLKNAQLGQNGFLTAGLIGLTLVYADRRPLLAGIFLALLAYKPQFGVLFPLALLAGARWRMLASAVATALILAVVVTLFFGRDIWLAYLVALHSFNAGLSPDRNLSVQLQSLFGWLRAHGAPAAAAMDGHLVAAVFVAGIVCWFWRQPTPPPLRAAILAVGAAAATPYVLTYDLTILAIAATFLVQDGLARGFLAGERLLLGLCVGLSFCLTAVVAPLLYTLMIGIAVWRRIALPIAATAIEHQPPTAFGSDRRLAATDQ